MKQKITLAVLMFLVILFAFGQGTELKYNELLMKSNAEKQLKRLKQDGNHVWQDHLFQKKRNFPQNSSMKSPQAIKQKLDSLVAQNWDETTNQWVASTKNEFTYDTNANNTQFIYYYRDETTNQWVGYFKYKYAYDATGSMIQYLFYGWDETDNEWVVGVKAENIYNVNGNLTQEFNYLWDETTNQWVASEKSEYTYDANGNMILFIFYGWDQNASQWVPYHKSEYTYDADRNMIQELNYNWDEYASQWVSYQKYEYNYDVNGNMTQFLYYEWDVTNSQWVPHHKEEYTYNANGNLTQLLRSGWNETTSQWVVDYKFEYTYDTSGNMTQNINYEWDQTTSQWVATYKSEFIYDNSYSFSDLILPYYFGGDDYSIYYNHMMTGSESYEWDTFLGDWKPLTEVSFNYSEQEASSVSDVDGAEFKVYPNPFSTYVSFNLSGYYDKIILNIFDIQGRKIITTEIRNGENVSMECLNNGMYFYNLNINGKKLVGKLIKK